MKHASPTEKKRRTYGYFVLAAVIYTVGIAAFSVWAYTDQRSLLLRQVDESLINATHAAEQILGTGFIERTVALETVQEAEHAPLRAKLGRFAEAYGFDLVLAVAVKSPDLWTIVGGIDPDGTISSFETQFKDPVHAEKLATLLRSMAAGESEPVSLLELQHPPYGRLRLGVRYTATEASSGYALVVVRNIAHVKRLLRPLWYRHSAIGLFLLAMAYPLVALYNRTRARSSRELADLNALLQQDIEIRKQRETELKDAIEDLERFNTVALGRESRIIELKAEVNTLLEQAKRSRRYNIDRKD